MGFVFHPFGYIFRNPCEFSGVWKKIDFKVRPDYHKRLEPLNIYHWIPIGYRKSWSLFNFGLHFFIINSRWTSRHPAVAFQGYLDLTSWIFLMQKVSDGRSWEFSNFFLPPGIGYSCLYMFSICFPRFGSPKCHEFGANFHGNWRNSLPTGQDNSRIRPPWGQSRWHYTLLLSVHWFIKIAIYLATLTLWCRVSLFKMLFWVFLIARLNGVKAPGCFCFLANRTNPDNVKHWNGGWPASRARKIELACFEEPIYWSLRFFQVDFWPSYWPCFHWDWDQHGDFTIQLQYDNWKNCSIRWRIPYTVSLFSCWWNHCIFMYIWASFANTFEHLNFLSSLQTWWRWLHLQLRKHYES